MNKRVVVDIDGVLADFERDFCQAFGWEHREYANLQLRYPNKSRHILEYINDPTSYKDLEPIQFGLSIVDWLNRSGFEVHIVTGRPFGLESITKRWLDRHGVIYSGFRYNVRKVGEIVSVRPLCAIDDLFAIQQSLMFHNIKTLLVSQPWNAFIEENIQRVSYISQVQKYFNELCPNN